LPGGGGDGQIDPFADGRFSPRAERNFDQLALANTATCTTIRGTISIQTGGRKKEVRKFEKIKWLHSSSLGAVFEAFGATRKDGGSGFEVSFRAAP